MTAPASSGPEAERDALFVAGDRDERESTERLSHLDAVASTSGRTTAALAAQIDGAALEAQAAAATARRERAAFERRRREREWDLRRLAPPVLFEFADALGVHANEVAMGRFEASANSNCGEASLRFRHIARELREDVTILPAGEMAETLARIRAEVSLMLLGVPAWQTRRLLPFLTEGETP